MRHFDYIFTGGGLSALSTLLHMSSFLESNSKEILVIDRVEKKANDRTFCYWSKDDHPFPSLISNSWAQLSFADQQGEVNSRMAGYSYHMVRADDFYAYAKEKLEKYQNISFEHSAVKCVQEEANLVKVWTDEDCYTANTVVNSIVDYKKLQPQLNEYLLCQHFMGWVIETKDKNFDTDKAMLMDFRTPQSGEARFSYVLPFSENRALVEFTAFSKDLMEDAEYRQAITNYLKAHWGIEEYQITEEEYGVIPMTNMDLRPWKGERIHHIGTPGGAVKPTTGYAFLNIQEQTRTLAKKILGLQGQEPIEKKSRFQFYDNLLLYILEHNGQVASSIFSALFRRNSMSTILDFLGEKSGWLQEIMLFLRLPFYPFLNALFTRRFNRLKEDAKQKKRRWEVQQNGIRT